MLPAIEFYKLLQIPQKHSIPLADITNAGGLIRSGEGAASEGKQERR